MLAALMRAHYRLRAKIRDKDKTHMGHSRLGIKPRLLLQDGDDMRKHLLLFLRQSQAVRHPPILFDELRRRKAQRHPDFPRLGLNHMRRRMDGAMHRSDRIALRLAVLAEVDAHRLR